MNVLISMTSGETHRTTQWADALQARLPKASIRVHGGEAITDPVDYLVTWQPQAGLIGQLPNVRAIFTASAGVDAILSDPDLPDCPVVRLRDAGMGQQMADFALYAGLHYQRGFDHTQRQQRASCWDPSPCGARNRPTVGVLGLGTLGLAAADALKANGFPVCGWSRRERKVDGIDTFAGMDELTRFLGASEMLLCLLPLTDETRHLLNRDRLAALPRDAVVVNLARGDIIVENDLLAALNSGHLRGAMLDVFETEPLPASHRFWSHPGVMVTPHVAAETMVEPGADQIAEEIMRLDRGETITSGVDRSAGY